MYHPTGPDAVIVAHPTLVIRVLPPCQNVLVAQVVGALIQDPGPALHTNRVAAAEVGVELRTVTITLIVATLEVFVLIKHDLEEEIWCSIFRYSIIIHYNILSLHVLTKSMSLNFLKSKVVNKLVF